MANLEPTESVCTEAALQGYGEPELFSRCVAILVEFYQATEFIPISDTDCLLAQLGTQFSAFTSSPWSFFACKLRMRVVCVPTSIPIRGTELVRLSVKAEIAVCRLAERLLLADLFDRHVGEN